MSRCIRRYLLYCNIWDAIIGDEVGCVRVLHNAMKGQICGTAVAVIKVICCRLRGQQRSKIVYEITRLHQVCTGIAHICNSRISITRQITEDHVINYRRLCVCIYQNQDYKDYSDCTRITGEAYEITAALQTPRFRHNNALTLRAFKFWIWQAYFLFDIVQN